MFFLIANIRIKSIGWCSEKMCIRDRYCSPAWLVPPNVIYESLSIWMLSESFGNSGNTSTFQCEVATDKSKGINMRNFIVGCCHSTLLCGYQPKLLPDLDLRNQSQNNVCLLYTSFFSKNDEELLKYKTLLQTINSLPNQQKQILYLFYIKGLSHKELSLIHI